MDIERILNMTGEEISKLYGSLLITLWFEDLIETFGAEVIDITGEYHGPKRLTKNQGVPAFKSNLVYNKKLLDISKKRLFEIFDDSYIPNKWYLIEKYIPIDKNDERPYRPIIVVEGNLYVPPGRLTEDVAKRVFANQDYWFSYPIGKLIESYNALPIPKQFK